MPLQDWTKSFPVSTDHVTYTPSPQWTERYPTTTNTNTMTISPGAITIIQQPGENSDDLARKVQAQTMTLLQQGFSESRR